MKNFIWNLILAAEAALGIISALFITKALLDNTLGMVSLVILVISGIAFYVTKIIKDKHKLKIKK